MDPAALEVWGRKVIERAAELVLAEIPAAQAPEAKTIGHAVSAGPGYVSRYTARGLAVRRARGMASDRRRRP